MICSVADIARSKERGVACIVSVEERNLMAVSQETAVGYIAVQPAPCRWRRVAAVCSPPQASERPHLQHKGAEQSIADAVHAVSGLAKRAVGCKSRRALPSRACLRGGPASFSYRPAPPADRLWPSDPFDMLLRPESARAAGTGRTRDEIGKVDYRCAALCACTGCAYACVSVLGSTKSQRGRGGGQNPARFR